MWIYLFHIFLENCSLRRRGRERESEWKRVQTTRSNWTMRTVGNEEHTHTHTIMNIDQWSLNVESSNQTALGQFVTIINARKRHDISIRSTRMVCQKFGLQQRNQRNLQNLDTKLVISSLSLSLFWSPANIAESNRAPNLKSQNENVKEEQRKNEKYTQSNEWRQK